MPNLPRFGAVVGVACFPPLAPHVDAHKQQFAQASAWPDRVVATIGADPARSLAVSRRTSGDVKVARAQGGPAQSITVDPGSVKRAGAFCQVIGIDHGTGRQKYDRGVVKTKQDGTKRSIVYNNCLLSNLRATILFLA